MFFQIIYDNYVEKIPINKGNWPFWEPFWPLGRMSAWFYNPISNEMESNYVEMIPLDIPPPVPDYSEHEIEKMRLAEEKRARKQAK